MTRDEAIARARKLLAFSPERGASQQEIETAGRLLERLMRQWNIEQAELDAGMGAPKGMGMLHIGPDRWRWPKWEAHLLGGLASSWGVRVLVSDGQPVRVIVGWEFDVQVVAYAFESVRNQIHIRWTDRPRLQRSSFAFGIVWAVLKSIQSERAEHGETQAVAVCNERKLGDADAWMESKGAEINKEIRRAVERPSDMEAFRAGIVAGTSITINPGLPGGNTP